jgi:uncharacterized protein YyaL (SSP411 family)
LIQIVATVPIVPAVEQDSYPVELSGPDGARRIVAAWLATSRGGVVRLRCWEMDGRVYWVPFLRYWRASGHEAYRRMGLLALQKMAQGGIYDHLGGGFHRYAVDAYWLVPHFEKMLYDNAQLIRL